MIPYVEIKNENRITIGIIDTAKSVIWHSVYFGVGDFEIYAQATPENIRLLKAGYYVTRQDNDEIGIIEHIAVNFTLIDGYMITATGRFAKVILDRRLIYNLSGTVNTPTILSGKVEIAARLCVQNNAINCTFDSARNIPIIGLAALKNLAPIIVDENGNPAQTQVSHQNLLEYTDALLKSYGMAAKMLFNSSNKKLLYSVYTGANRSVYNTDGNDPVVFSVDYDNLNSSELDYDTTNERTAALVGGAGQGLSRFYTMVANAPTGLQRREMFVDASNINKTYKSGDTEREYTTEQYSGMLYQKGKTELNKHLIIEKFTGEVNATFSTWIFNRDYFLGDIVDVQDNRLERYNAARITEVTEVQDENGYNINVVFGE